MSVRAICTKMVRVASLPSLRAAAGTAIGGVMLWLALRGTSTAELLHLSSRVQLPWIAFAMMLYWVELALRTARWGTLLYCIGPMRSPAREGYGRVGEVLLVGYAVNNVLPARLGELFRADYGGRRLALKPTAVFGTIVAERLIDAVMVAGGLCVGLALLGWFDGGVAPGYREPLSIIAGGGAAVIAAALTIIWSLTRWPRLLNGLPSFARQTLHDVLEGLGCFRRVSLGYVVAISLIIWLLEAGAMWSLTRAAGASLGLGQSVVLVGAVSLGTLVPTAPAYLGTHQLIFGFCLASFGYPVALGVLGASLAQLFLLAPVTLAGLFLYSSRHFLAMLRVTNG